MASSMRDSAFLSCALQVWPSLTIMREMVVVALRSNHRMELSLCPHSPDESNAW